MHLALAGQAEAFAEGAAQLLLTVGLAILVIYMVLAAQFESLVHPLTVMLALPLAMVGALGGLLLGIIYALFLDYLQVRTLARKLKQIEGQDWFEEAVNEEYKRREQS